MLSRPPVSELKKMTVRERKILGMQLAKQAFDLAVKNDKIVRIPFANNKKPAEAGFFIPVEINPTKHQTDRSRQHFSCRVLLASL